MSNHSLQALEPRCVQTGLRVPCIIPLDARLEQNAIVVSNMPSLMLGVVAFSSSDEAGIG